MIGIPDFSKTRLLVAGDGEPPCFGEAFNGIADSRQWPAACGRADHGAREAR